MKKYILTVLTLGMLMSSYGQDILKRNYSYLEAGGNGLFASVNYERQLTKEPGISARIGIGFYTEKAFFLTIPVGINYLFPLKKDNSFIDAGLGITWTREEGKLLRSSKNFDGFNYVNFIPSIGYRKHVAKDVMWRISVTPIANKYGLFPWIGASVGRRF